MRATSKFIIAIGAAALVTVATSVGASAAPIQPRISTDGLSEINLPPDLISSFAADGVTMSAAAGAKVSTNGSTGYTTVKFPVTKPVKNGVISNRGTLVFTSSITTVKLTLSNPTINFDGGTASTGTMASTFSVTVPCTTPKSCQGWTPEPE